MHFIEFFTSTATKTIFIPLCGQINLMVMSKTLEVIKPFDILDEGDVFELTADGKYYVCEYNEENSAFEGAGNFSSSYNTSYKISVDYAKALVNLGILSEETENESSDFVNVFDEIDRLLAQYTGDLNSIDKNLPTVLKVEKTTVLENLIKVLNHLKSLKK